MAPRITLNVEATFGPLVKAAQRRDTTFCGHRISDVTVRCEDEGQTAVFYRRGSFVASLPWDEYVKLRDGAE